MHPALRALAARWPLGAALLTPFAVAVAYRGYVPMFDAVQYFECATTYPAEGRFWGLMCQGHYSFVFMGLHALAQAVAPGSYLAAMLVDAGLAAVAIAGVARLAAWVLPGDEHAADRAIATGVFAVHPLVTAHVVQMSPDLGILSCTPWILHALVTGRRWQAAAWGLAAALCKEPGLALFAVFAMVWAIWSFVRAERGRRLGALRAVWPLSIPIVAMAMLMWAKGRFASGSALWHGLDPKAIVLQAFVPRVTPVMRAYAAEMLVLDFAWVPAIAGVVGMVVALVRRRKPAAEAVLIALWLAAALFTLTRFETFANPRYCLGFLPLLLTAGLAASAPLPRLPRRVALVVFGVVLAASNRRTIDPVSRAIFGTFRFGDHAMLRMTSITGECCGYGRDQLVYSPEFTRLAQLQDVAYGAERPGPDRRLASDTRASWYMIGPLDRETRERRATAGPGAFTMDLLDADRVERGERPPLVLWLAFPNFDQAADYRRMLAFYDQAAVRTYARSGYRLDVRELRLRAAPRR